MRIGRPLHVLDTSLPIVAGYTSRARALLEGQIANGLAPSAVTGARQGRSGIASEDLYGVRHYRTNTPAGLDRIATTPGVREAIEMGALGKRLREAAKLACADLIHAHSPVLCGLPAVAVARALGLPFVYEIRAFWEDAAVNQKKSGEDSMRYAAIRAAETALVKASDAVVAICEGIKRDLVNRGVDPSLVFTVPNGVDTSRFTPLPRDDAFARSLGLEGKKVIAFVGTMFHFEGVPMFVDALARMVARDDSVRGLVVGYGESLDAVKRRKEELGLGDKLLVTGKVAPSEVAKYYGVADVLVYPRERHRITELTTPLKPLEAMSMGKAVLGSDVGGIQELVKDGETGILFKAGDVEDLEGAATQLLRDERLRLALGERARADMLENRDWKKIAARYLAVYEAAAERRASRTKLAA